MARCAVPRACEYANPLPRTAVVIKTSAGRTKTSVQPSIREWRGAGAADGTTGVDSVRTAIQASVQGLRMLVGGLADCLAGWLLTHVRMLETRARRCARRHGGGDEADRHSRDSAMHTTLRVRRGSRGSEWLLSISS